MAVVKIKDAPFTQKVKAHLIAMGIVEADWGHPNVILDNPIEYFRKQLAAGDDTIQMKGKVQNIPTLRGTNLRDDFRKKVLLGRAQKPRMYRVSQGNSE